MRRSHGLASRRCTATAASDLSSVRAARGGITAAALPAFLACLLVLPACGGEGSGSVSEVGGYGDGVWHGSVDTLAGGAAVVENPARGVWTKEEAWRIEEELRIGARGGEAPEVFGPVTALAVDGHGRVWTADNQSGEIRVFGPDGVHLRTVGGQGEGPREFRMIAGLEVAGRGRMVAIDRGNSRYAVWDTAGRFLATHRRELHPMTALPWRGVMDPEGRLWEVRGGPMFPGEEREAIVYDTTFEPVASRPLPLPHDPEAWAGAGEFPRDLILRLDPPDRVWFSRPWNPRIVQRRLSGDTVRVIDWEVEPPRRSEEERREILQRATGRMGHIRAAAGGEGGGAGPELSDVPERDPLYGALWLDERDHLWAVPYHDREPFTVDRFHVFDPRGRYLGPAVTDVPLSGAPTPVFRDGKLWAVTRDSLGVHYVVRARIVRPEGDGEEGAGS